MRKCIIIISIFLLACGICRSQVSYERADSTVICQLLRDARQQPSSTCLPLWFARQFIGRPYVAHTLERFDTEQLIVNTRQMDCTTLVETVAALTLCAQHGQTAFADFVAMLRTLRYREGRLAGYPSRLHYFTDWIDDNAQLGLVSEVQHPVPPFSATQQVNVSYMSSHPESYKALKSHPAFVPVIRQQEQLLTGRRYRYIPTQQIRNTALLRSAVKDGDIIAIVTSKQGLDIAHLGFAVWQRDGLHLLNASMLHKRVVLESMTLRQYLTKHPSFKGIRIVKIENLNKIELKN